VATNVVGSTGLIQGGATAVRVVPDQVTYYFQVRKLFISIYKQIRISILILQQQHQQPQQAAQQSSQQSVQPQIIQLQVNFCPIIPKKRLVLKIKFQPQQMVNTIAPPAGGIQIVQQIIGANGEIQVQSHSK